MIQNETIHAFINATKLRAKAYAFFFEELAGEFDREKALEICSKVAYRLGLDKASGFSLQTKADVYETARSFASDPVASAVFDLRLLSHTREEAIIEMKRCPLVEQWQSMEYNEADIRTLCEFAHKIDYGTVEGTGCKLEFKSRISYGGTSCLLRIFT